MSFLLPSLLLSGCPISDPEADPESVDDTGSEVDPSHPPNVNTG